MGIIGTLLHANAGVILVASWEERRAWRDEFAKVPPEGRQASRRMRQFTGAVLPPEPRMNGRLSLPSTLVPRSIRAPCKAPIASMQAPRHRSTHDLLVEVRGRSEGTMARALGYDCALLGRPPEGTTRAGPRRLKRGFAFGDGPETAGGTASHLRAQALPLVTPTRVDVAPEGISRAALVNIAPRRSPHAEQTGPPHPRGFCCMGSKQGLLVRQHSCSMNGRLSAPFDSRSAYAVCRLAHTVRALSAKQ
jgi:hypothetical protein